MKPTPETDAAQFGTGRVSVEFARRLERERDDLLQALENLMADVRMMRGQEWHSFVAAQAAISKAKGVDNE